jgi:hypothetical protein
MSGTMVGSELHPARAASNPAARRPAILHRPTDWISLLNNAAASVHAVDRFVKMYAPLFDENRLLFLRHDPSCVVHEYAVAVAVPACRDVVVVRLLFGTDDLAAWRTQQHEDGCQILEQRNAFRSRRRSGEERREREYQGRSPGTFDQDASPRVRFPN